MTNKNRQISFLTVDGEKINIAHEYKKAVIDRVYNMAKKYAPSINAKSFIAWIGGKTRMAEHVAKMCSGIPHDIYVEPFCGGASVYFEKAPANINILNDTNGNLVNLFDQLKDNTDEFLFKLFHTVKSKEKFDEYKKIYRKHSFKDIPPVDRAIIYFYLITYTYAADESSLHFAFSDRKILYQIFSNLIRCAEKLNSSSTSILNKDYKYILQKFMKKKNVLFFLDPPYWITMDGRYYKYTFTREDHYQLAKYIDQIHDHGNYFILTYDDVPEIKNLYKKYRITKFNMIYYAKLGKNIRKDELIITNTLVNSQLNLF